MRPYSAAFSLLEMLIVMSIMGFLGLIVVNFQSLTESTKLQINQEKIIAAINQAQTLAIADGEKIYLCFANGRYNCVQRNVKYVVMFYYKNEIRKLLSKIKLEKTAGTFHWRLFPKSKLAFNFQATLVTNGTIWYCDSHRKPQFAISINKLGTATKLKPDAMGNIADSLGKPLPCQ